MTPLELKDVHISTIKPFKKSHHAAIVEASLLDLSFLDIYIPTVYFYKAAKQSDAGLVIAKMKESLSKVLVPFFPFAGRWVKTYDSRVRELQCSDEGVPFIEASVDVELDSAIRMGTFQVNPQLAGFEQLGFDPTAFDQDVDQPLPAVFVQVTRFKCGGVALNVSVCHMNADGQGMSQFMKGWSEFTVNDEASITANHDRSLIFPRKAFMDFVGAELGSPPVKDDAELKTSASSKRNGASLEETPRTDPGDAYRFQSIEHLLGKIFHVKRKAIEDLKRKAADEKVNISTVDLISAHLWQSASSLVHSAEMPSVLSTYVDGRKRFHNPPLPDSYIGNAVVLASTAPIALKELASQSLPSAASNLHNAVAGVNASTWKYSLLQTMQMAPLAALPFAHFTISSWLRFPVYELTFGCGYGNPVFVCWNNSSRFLPLGAAIILPPPPSYAEDTIASVQIFAAEKEGFAQTLFSDDKFLTLFHTPNRPLWS